MKRKILIMLVLLLGTGSLFAGGAPFDEGVVKVNSDIVLLSNEYIDKYHVEIQRDFSELFKESYYVCKKCGKDTCICNQQKIIYVSESLSWYSESFPTFEIFEGFLCGCIDGALFFIPSDRDTLYRTGPVGSTIANCEIIHPSKLKTIHNFYKKIVALNIKYPFKKEICGITVSQEGICLVHDSEVEVVLPIEFFMQDKEDLLDDYKKFVRTYNIEYIRTARFDDLVEAETLEESKIIDEIILQLE